MRSADNSLEFNGDYNLHSIFLGSFRYQDKIDITPLFSFIEVFESIYSPFISMNIGIIDAAGLMDKARIIGDEFIEIDLRDADNETGYRNQTFYIYKISDRISISDRGTSYTINCISLPALADMNMLVSKAYKGQPSDIVTAIYQQFYGAQKTLIVEETKNSVHYISNYWSPLKNIKLMTDRAVSRKTNSSAYYFFETKKEFIFCSLNMLVQQTATNTFFYTINNKVLGDEFNKSMIIEKLYVDESFDYIKRLKSGAYGNRTLVVNPLSKQYNYGYYDFVDSFNVHSRLNQEPFTSFEAPRKLNSVFRHRIAPDRTYTEMASEKTSEWFAQNMTEYSAIDSQKIEIDVPGHLRIHAGSVSNIFIYTDVITKGDNPETAYDSVFSGRYLVTSIKHLFTKERHSMHLELSKDSLINVGGNNK